MKTAQYLLKSAWKIEGPLLVTSTSIMKVTDWPLWWPGLEVVQNVVEKPAIVGSTAKMTWKAATGYKINIYLTATDYRNGKDITFSSEGDLKGTGKWLFEAKSPNVTKIEMTWEVATTKPWMTVLSPLLRPFFIYNHRKLMRDGETGLNKFLQKA